MSNWYDGLDLYNDICVCGKDAGSHGGIDAGDAACPDPKSLSGWSTTSTFTLAIIGNGNGGGKKVADLNQIVVEGIRKVLSRKYTDACPCGIHPDQCDYHKGM